MTDATLMTRRRGQIATTVVAGLSAMMMTLDATVVNVAIEAIGTEFSAKLSQLQWVINGYTLAFAALLLSAGSLSDRLGRRGTFLIGMIVFTLASAVCSFAPAAGLLVAARIVQGLGGALVMGTGLALIAGAYEGEDPKRRQTAIGLFTGLGAAAAALGPLIGGALIESGGWRLIFLINLPVGVLIIIGTLLFVRKQPRTDGARLDLSGAALAVLVLFALNYGLLTGSSESWERADVLASLVGATVLMIVFLVLEARLGNNAMLDLSLFRIPTFSGAIILSFAARLASFGLFPFLILWLTGILGHTPFQVGLILLAMSVGMLLVAPFSGYFSRFLPIRVLCFLGMTIVGAGLIWASVLITPTSDWTAILPGLILIGVGSGIVMPHMMGLAVGVVPADRAGMASGMSNSFFPIGTALGVACYGAIMNATIDAQITEPDAAAAVAAGRIDELAASLPAGAEQFIAQAREAFVAGLSTTLLVAGIASIVSALAALALIRAKDIHDAPQSEIEAGQKTAR